MSKFNFPVKAVQIFAALVIGVICFYYIVISFNWNQIWLSVQKVNYIVFFFASSATLATYFFIRTLRWYFLLKGENVEIPFSKLYLYSAFSIGVSTITPFQSGEALKVELIRKHGGKRLSGYAIFFLERIFDLLTVIGLAIISTGLGLDFGIKPIYLLFVGFCLIIVLSGAAAFIFLLPSEKLEPIRIWLKGNWQKKWNLLLAFGLTIFSWMTIIYGWKLALSFFSINIDFLQSVSLVTLTTLLTILSFVPGAIGVSELSVSTILTGMGIEPSTAQAGAIAIRAYALVILILTLLHWLYLKFIYKKKYGVY